jgi:hypothetical protein
MLKLRFWIGWIKEKMYIMFSNLTEKGHEKLEFQLERFIETAKPLIAWDWRQVDDNTKHH